MLFPLKIKINTWLYFLSLSSLGHEQVEEIIENRQLLISELRLLITPEQLNSLNFTQYAPLFPLSFFELSGDKNRV